MEVTCSRGSRGGLRGQKHGSRRQEEAAGGEMSLAPVASASLGQLLLLPESLLFFSGSPCSPLTGSVPEQGAGWMLSEHPDARGLSTPKSGD